MKKIIGAIAIIALAVIVGIGAGYYFTHQNSGSPQNASTTSSTATISEAEAQQIALEDAGLAEADVSFTKQNSTATTAASNMRSNLSPVLTTPSTIMRSTHRAAPFFPLTASRGATAMHSKSTTTSPQAADEITADEAKAIALQHAGVAEADALYIDIDYDRDDGVNEWSVDFATQDTEYDYEIAAADGSIMKSEREPYRP